MARVHSTGIGFRVQFPYAMMLQITFLVNKIKDVQDRTVADRAMAVTGGGQMLLRPGDSVENISFPRNILYLVQGLLIDVSPSG